MSRFSCPGLQKVTEPGRVWFVPKGCTMMGATYCQECFAKLVKSHQIDRADFTEFSQTDVGPCNCDYEPNSLVRNGVRISVCDADIKTTLVRFPLLHNVEAQKAGVIHPILPTGANFKIVFENLNVKKPVDNWMYTEPDHGLVHLTLESAKCGEEKIIVKDQNGNTNLVYLENIIIDSFESGTSKSFQFIAEEKQDSKDSETKSKTEKKNIFSFEIGQFTKICKAKPVYTRDPPDRWGDKPRFGEGGRLGRDSGSGTDRRPLNLRRRPTDLFADRDFNPFLEAERSIWRGTGSVSFQKEQEQKIVPFDQLLGGKTEFGGIKTATAQSTSTNAEWTKLGEPVKFMVQIVCDQSPEEIRRANSAIALAKDVAKCKKLEEANTKLEKELISRVMQLESIQAEIDNIKTQFAQNHHELANLKHAKKKPQDFLL